MNSKIQTILLPDEQATKSVARQIAPHLKIGDVLLLEGQIGAGKTYFARSLIRAIFGTIEDVPSPTFTLVQTYEGPQFEIWHFDLYRLTSSDEAFELGLDEAIETAVSIIEWPDRLGPKAPENALFLAFETSPAGHSLKLYGNQDWAIRLKHLDD